MTDIKVGDLVIIVRGHECILRKYGGIIRTVVAIHQPKLGGWHCHICHRDNAGGDEPGAQLTDRFCGTPLSWLKRIDPLAEPETTEHHESITA